MRTLVISDLHIGARTGRDVVRHPEVLEQLCAAVREADRLVLLGDTVEMLEGRPRQSLAQAEPVVRALGEALGDERPLILVPGNHDHALIEPWVDAQLASGAEIDPCTRVPLHTSTDLEVLAECARPARLEVHYPAVDLGDGVWAHHGHYLDRHLLRTPLPSLGDSVAGYERSLGVTVSRVTASVAASLPPAVGSLIDELSGVVARGAVLSRPLVARMPGASALAPLSSGLLGYQFRRSGLPAIGQVAEDLGVPADGQLLFGHVHRLGPQAEDPREEWVQLGRQLHNTGCWVYEPLLLAATEPPHPYWPGGALWVEGAVVRPVNLLESVDPQLLR